MQQWRDVNVPSTTAFGVLVTCVGGVVLAALFGLSSLSPLADLWRHLFGLLSLPVALAVTVAGIGVIAKRHDDALDLPWGRSLGVEVAGCSVLALLASAFGAPLTFSNSVPLEPGPGGLIGWSLSAVTSAAVGPVLSTLVWFVVGLVGLLAVFRIGASHLAARLDALADALLEGVPVAQPDGAAVNEVGAATSTGVAAATASGIDPRVGTVGSSGQPRPAPDGTRSGKRAAASDKPRSGTSGSTSGGTAGGASGRTTSGADSAGEQSAPVVRRVRETTGTTKGPAKRKRSKKAGLAAHLPEFEILDDDSAAELDDDALQAMAKAIEGALGGFGVPAQVVEIEQGPTVTRFGVKPGMVESGSQPRRVRVAKITALKSDLALALAAPTVRIEAPIPGRPLVGIEVPNPELEVVGLKGILDSKRFRAVADEHTMAVALGRDVAGAPLVADLAALPHLLVAGATGTGKSVCLDAILASLLFQATPDTLRLLLIDPKRVELVRFDGLPHLVSRVVTDVAEIVGALRWVVAEMEGRYRRFEETGVRDRDAHNERSPAGQAPMPALLVVIDELADMMMVAPEATEPLLVRVAQLGRATGIHLVVATQRPSVDVVTGLIKANFPARISFAVASGTDSRVVLDQLGAETLLGRGDMLYQAPDAAAPRRAQGAYVSDSEITKLVGFWASSHWEVAKRVPPWTDLVEPLDPNEALYERAKALAGERTDVTASLLQRRLHVGYRTARSLYDRLVEDGWADDRSARGSGDRSWVDDEFEGP